MIVHLYRQLRVKSRFWGATRFDYKPRMPVAGDDYEWEKYRGKRIIAVLRKALTSDRNWPAQVLRSDVGRR